MRLAGAPTLTNIEHVGIIPAPIMGAGAIQIEKNKKTQKLWSPDQIEHRGDGELHSSIK
jgi:hypothetical protein